MNKRTQDGWYCWDDERKAGPTYRLFIKCPYDTQVMVYPTIEGDWYFEISYAAGEYVVDVPEAEKARSSKEEAKTVALDCFRRIEKERSKR